MNRIPVLFGGPLDGVVDDRVGLPPFIGIWSHRCGRYVAHDINRPTDQVIYVWRES